MRIFSGNANRPLAQAIADAVGARLGEMTCDRFPDGEVKVQIQEDVRGADVFVVQPTTTNDFLMELLVISDALRRASANRITAVVPYFGYARQDRKHEGRVPITAAFDAALFPALGATRSVGVPFLRDDSRSTRSRTVRDKRTAWRSTHSSNTRSNFRPP